MSKCKDIDIKAANKKDAVYARELPKQPILYISIFLYNII